MPSAARFINKEGLDDFRKSLILKNKINGDLTGDLLVQRLAHAVQALEFVLSRVVVLPGQLINRRQGVGVKAQHEKAVRILTDNRAKLDELAQYLYQKETITGEEFMEILNREPAQAQ